MLVGSPRLALPAGHSISPFRIPSG